MVRDFGSRLLNSMLRGMSKGANEEINEIFEELRKEALDPQKIMEMARAMGIDMSQLSGMMGQGQGQGVPGATGFDPYQILGLDKSASDQEVKDRYNELLHKLHPDKSGTPGTQFLLQMVMAAYEMIKKERGW